MTRNILLMTLVMVGGCMPAVKNTLSDRTLPVAAHGPYLEEMRRESLSFELPRSEGADAWSRAQSFLGQYSTMKIQMATDSVIQTYNPPHGEVGPYSIIISYGYSVARSPVGDKHRYTVSCHHSFSHYKRKLIEDSARVNAGIFARHIRTGELPHPELVSR